MQVVRGHRLTAELDIRYQSYAASEPLLEGFDLRQVPVWTPEVGLASKANETRILNGPRRESGLALVGGKLLRALRQLLEFGSKDEVQLQSPGDFACNVKAVRPFCIQVYFLQEDDVSFSFFDEFENPLQLC